MKGALLSRGQVIPPAHIQEAATKLLQTGMHPSVVRQRLAEYGLHWQYDYQRVARQGQRERTRRLKQQGLALCPICDGGTYPIASSLHICAECLERKWSSIEKLGPAGLR